MITDPVASFPPIVAPGIRFLVLGSLPGERSLAAGEYYAHPRNRFWRVLAAINGSHPPIEYSEKLKLLETMRIGLWDVAGEARRAGSLDSNITDAVPNPVVELIDAHPTLIAVGFNGRKAESLYDRHFQRRPAIRYFSLPSTSPANAGFSESRLVEIWQKMFV